MFGFAILPFFGTKPLVLSHLPPNEFLGVKISLYILAQNIKMNLLIVLVFLLTRVTSHESHHNDETPRRCDEESHHHETLIHHSDEESHHHRETPTHHHEEPHHNKCRHCDET